MQALDGHRFGEAVPNIHNRYELADVAQHPVFVSDRIGQRPPGQRLATEARRTSADDQVLARRVHERGDEPQMQRQQRARSGSSRIVAGGMLS